MSGRLSMVGDRWNRTAGICASCWHWSQSLWMGGLLLIAVVAIGRCGHAAETYDRYYAHPAVHDANGVIAPWYTAQNGQLDFRIRVAAETLKRYPWTTIDNSIECLPHFLFSGHWKIADDGTITPLPVDDWSDGDLGQRAAYVLSGFVDYYRYSGDPAAIRLMSLQADFLLDHCLTPADHPWPNFLISVPIKGKPYGKCDPRGMIQLDITAEVGIALLKAYQVTGNRRWLEACQHWGDLLASKRSRADGEPPWGRYANPEAAPWPDVKQTGGVVFLAYFFDELIRLGYTGVDDEIIRARDASRDYLHRKLLPQWTVNDIWGRNYWDWDDPVQAENVTEFAARYFMDYPAAFPNWRNDARNILSLFLNHTSVCPTSAGEVYSGAWAFPESSGCCGRSLWYGPMELAVAFAQYGQQADSAWGRELARRMQILATYDGHETGVSEDNIDGGFVVNDAWFKIAHPMALKHLLGTLAWLPVELGAARENHIVRTTAVISSVVYRQGSVRYTTFDAPADTIDVLRLAFAPDRVTADGQMLEARGALTANGYRVVTLPSGDTLVSIRHDGTRSIVVEGADPQQQNDDAELTFAGQWTESEDAADFGGRCHTSAEAGAEVEVSFTGNQLRLIGRVGPRGGLADVYLDSQKQLVDIDCWSPEVRQEQVLYYRNGLADGPHTLRLVVRGEKNPKSDDAEIYVDAVQWSAAQGTSQWGEGGGPVDAQRLVMGYPGREDLRDSRGNLWRPGTELVVRTGSMTDSVTESWWTTPAPPPVADSADAELYRYGVHAPQFCVNVTVGPGTYNVRLKFAASRRLDTCQNCVSIAINGQPMVSKMDVSATARGTMRGADLVFPDIQPRNGVIDIRFIGGDAARQSRGEAFVQAIEVSQGPGQVGATPITMLGRNLLRNSGFEQWTEDASGTPEADSWQFDAMAGSTASLEPVVSPPDDEQWFRDVAEGNHAVRIAGSGRSHLTQQVAVCPSSNYRASVLVSARAGKGSDRNQSPLHSANLLLEELDAEQQVIAEHRQAPDLEEDAYRYLSCEFATSPQTASVRFVLETRVDDPSITGPVRYDHCVLDGPPSPAQAVGTVRDQAGNPLPGAVITVGAQTLRTAADGTFVMSGLTDLLELSLQAAKQGYYDQSHVLRLGAGENRCDFNLKPLPSHNLLLNGDFEQGFAAARSMEHGTKGDRDPWHFLFSAGTACYIYPESIYKWRKPHVLRGQEAISQVTDGGGTMELSQDVIVDANQPLVASVWILGLDVSGNGEGFGAGARDFAGIVVQELDAQGQVLVQHERVGIDKATEDFQQVAMSLTTQPNTVKVRFTLTSCIECIWQKGAAIFDDCVLQPAAVQQ